MILIFEGLSQLNQLSKVGAGLPYVWIRVIIIIFHLFAGINDDSRVQAHFSEINAWIAANATWANYVKWITVSAFHPYDCEHIHTIAHCCEVFFFRSRHTFSFDMWYISLLDWIGYSLRLWYTCLCVYAVALVWQHHMPTRNRTLMYLSKR